MLRHWLLPLSGALLYTISLPPFGYDWAAFLVGIPLALLVLDPQRPLRPAAAWATGLLFGEAATLAVGGHWLYVATHEFFGKPAAFSLAFTLLTTITHAGAFIGAGIALAARFSSLRSPYARAIALGAIWVSFEFLRGRLLYGCPWDFLGHALARRPDLLGLAAYGGAYALSWLCIVSGALAGQALLARGARNRAALVLAAIALPAAIWGVGPAEVTGSGSDARTKAERLTVGLVQPGVGRHELWDPALRGNHLERLLELSRSPELAGADLIVWPENAVPFLLDADSDARAKISQLARETGAYVMTGAPRSQGRADGTALFHNAAYLFAPNADGYDVYDKVQLLPYVEATPAFARNLLPRAGGIEYTPGSERTLFDVRGWKIAPLICFESTYPDITREAALAGADLFVNLSNDSWFDRGAAPEQHFGMTLLRTVETARPLVRVANTGVSAVVDANGSLIAALPVTRAAVGLYEITRARTGATFYTRFGDLFAWLCVVFAAGAWLGVKMGYGRPVDSGRP